jgi:hypothetical protein
VQSIYRLHAEAAALFDLRRRQRFLSKIVQSWRFEANSHAVAAEVELKESKDLSSLAFKVSPSLGKLLFEKVVAALGDDVKTTLQLR